MKVDFFKELAEKHQIELNEQQRAAAGHRTGPALVLAASGARPSGDAPGPAAASRPLPGGT